MEEILVCATATFDVRYLVCGAEYGAVLLLNVFWSITRVIIDVVRIAIAFKFQRRTRKFYLATVRNRARVSYAPERVAAASVEVDVHLEVYVFQQVSRVICQHGESVRSRC